VHLLGGGCPYTHLRSGGARQRLRAGVKRLKNAHMNDIDEITITLDQRFMPRMLGREEREAGGGQYVDFARGGWAGRTRSSMILKTLRG
jgi:hypothetical protein